MNCTYRERKASAPKKYLCDIQQGVSETRKGLRTRCKHAVEKPIIRATPTGAIVNKRTNVVVGRGKQTLGLEMRPYRGHNSCYWRENSIRKCVEVEYRFLASDARMLRCRSRGSVRVRGERERATLSSKSILRHHVATRRDASALASTFTIEASRGLCLADVCH